MTIAPLKALCSGIPWCEPTESVRVMSYAVEQEFGEQ